jgi:Flp pilus assembly protein TadD
LGKILLARGSAEDAVGHLEVASRLSPEDANVHYQLGVAYQRLGRVELAAKEFEVFQRLKDKVRGGKL